MRDTPHRRIGSLLYWIMVVGVGGIGVLFLVAPVAIAVLMSLTGGQTLKFPPEGLSLHWYQMLLDAEQSAPLHRAILNSLTVAFWAAIVSAAIAIPAAVGLSRMKRTSGEILELIVLAPLLLPSLVYGLAALVTANALGFRPSQALLVAGHVAVFSPLLYRATAALTESIDPSLEEASTTMGASSMRTFLRVVLPLLSPGALAGAFLVFMQSLDNVSVSLFLADPAASLLPLRMFQMLQEWLDVRVAAISGVLILATTLLVVTAYRLRLWPSLFGNTAGSGHREPTP
jgi:putative spermidine/putrescine transport system permease protein